MTIRVVVADDHALIRASFSMLVDADPGLVVVGQAETGAEAVALARRTRPDVVLMDIRMPDLDGIEATRQLTAASSTGQTRVLMLTTFDIDEYVYGALRAGASGFLLKETPPAELIAAIKVVAAGDALIAPQITRRLIAEFARRPGLTRGSLPELPQVTSREREVLVLIARGSSNAELAAKLHVTLATAKTHVSRLLTKLNARDRAQLVIYAYENGLVVPAPASQDAHGRRPT